jgi:hypothetical protein
VALLLVGLVVVPAPGSAARAKHPAGAKHGVKARVGHRTLTITGNRRANSVTLRRKGRSLIVDVQSNGSADFKFRLKSFRRIAVNGGRGKDRLVLTGTGKADSFALSRRGRRLRVPRAPGARPLSGRGVETVQVNPLGGADTVAVGNLTRTDVKTASVQLGSRRGGDGAADSVSVAATAGDDSVTATRAGSAATVRGLSWSVSVANAESADRLSLNGAAGNDTLHLSGTPADDSMDISAAGPLLHAAIGGSSVETDDFEAVRVEPLAGQDTLTVGDLTGTDVGQVAADLGVSPGGPPDGQADSLTITGRDGADTIAVSGGPTGVIASGLAAGHSMLAPDPVDRLTVNGLGGVDSLNAAGLAPNATSLTLRGGADNDALTGSPGDDTFGWEPGDGIDTVEGGGGNDTTTVAGSDAAESFTVAPNGARVLMQVALATVVDMDDVETANFVPRGGTDAVDVPPALPGTDLTGVTAELGADGVRDNVNAQATTGPDDIKVTPSGAGATVGGLGLKTSAVTAEPDTDNMTILGLTGLDKIDASAVPARIILLTLDAGSGPDAEILIGSQGRDTILGRQGNDFELMGAGDDTSVWNPGEGNDTVEGQDGTDRLLFNGANINEQIDIDANGGRLRFTRDVASVTMDCDKVETVDFNALGGTDTVVIHDLTGTGDVTQVNVNLAVATGAGDGSVDTVFLNGTGGADNINLTGGPNPVSVTGLFTALSVAGGEPGDGLRILGGAGNDTINAAGVAAGSPLLTLQGDDNDDTITGSLHVDNLFGGNGDDTIFFTPGDNVDGGTGTNTILPQ